MVAMVKRAARAKFLEQRDGERRAFFRSRAGAHFVHENERAIGGDFQHGFQIEHVRGKRGEVGGDGLLVADIGEHAIEDRQLGALGGDGNCGLRGERGEADGFERDGFAAGVRAADDHHGFVAAESERTCGTALRPCGRSVASSTGLRAASRRSELPAENSGIDAIEFTRETSARENGIEMSDIARRRLRAGPRSARRRSVSSARMRAISASFVFGELHETIIQIDGFERLDENGLPRGAGGVNDARNVRGGRRRERE